MLYIRYMLAFTFNYGIVHVNDSKCYYDDYASKFTCIMRGVIGMIGAFFWFLAVVLLPLGDALTLSMISPAVALILAYLIYHEEITALQKFCVFGGFIGILFIAKPPFIMQFFVEVEKTDEDTNRVLGVIAGMLGGVGYAVESLVIHSGPTVDNWALTQYLNVIAGMLFPICGNFETFVNPNIHQLYYGLM